MRIKNTNFHFGRVQNCLYRFNTKLSERGWMRDSLMYKWKLKARGGRRRRKRAERVDNMGLGIGSLPLKFEYPLENYHGPE